MKGLRLFQKYDKSKMMNCIDDLKSPEPLGEYQTNMAQYILDCLEFMKDHAS